MTPQEYQKARQEYEGKKACGGCGLFLIVFGMFPVTLVTLGAVPSLVLTGGAFCLFMWGMLKWMEEEK